MNLRVYTLSATEGMVMSALLLLFCEEEEVHSTFAPNTSETNLIKFSYLSAERFCYTLMRLLEIH